jgi:hypothetical protein
MWPEGEKSITSVTRRPLTAGTIFRTSMMSLSNLLSSKVIYKIYFFRLFIEIYFGFFLATILCSLYQTK